MFLTCEKCFNQADWICKGCGKLTCQKHTKVIEEIGYCEECQKNMQTIL